MHFAAVYRMARLCGQPRGSRVILHCRLAMSILVVSSVFLFSPHAVYAQSEIGPARTPIGAVVPHIAPIESDFLSVDTIESDVIENDTKASTTSDLIHEIVVGDTLTNVAQRYNVELANLAAYNQILDYNNVVIGQKLRIPPVGVTITPAVETKLGADGYHVVRKGESLSAIARLYNLTLAELMALNEIEEPNIVQMGMMLRLTEDVELPSETIRSQLDGVTYEVKRDDTLSEIAQAYFTTVAQILKDNDLTSENVELHVGQTLRIIFPATALEAFGVDAPVDGERKILIDLSEQTLTAYQGDVVVLYSIVSTGKDSTPTRPGEFATYAKYKSQHMTGDDYDLPGVPWVMYYDDEYAIHGAYWHANFGIPTSHGCTNMSIPESQALYSWAPIGTRVIVQE